MPHLQWILPRHVPDSTHEKQILVPNSLPSSPQRTAISGDCTWAPRPPLSFRRSSAQSSNRWKTFFQCSASTWQAWLRSSISARCIGRGATSSVASATARNTRYPISRSPGGNLETRKVHARKLGGVLGRRLLRLPIEQVIPDPMHMVVAITKKLVSLLAREVIHRSDLSKMWAPILLRLVGERSPNTLAESRHHPPPSPLPGGAVEAPSRPSEPERVHRCPLATLR